MKLTLCILLFSSLNANIIVSNSDLLNLFNKHSFYKNHDLDLVVSSFPFESNFFENNDYLKIVNDNYLRLSTRFESGQSNKLIGSGLLSGSIGPNFLFLVEPTIVNKQYSRRELGIDYSRLGISGRFTNAFIRYNSKNTILQFGRSPIWWGQSWNSALVHSRNAFPIDHISLKFNKKNILLEILTGQLSSIKKNGLERVRRNFAGHRIIWVNDNKTLLFSLGESVIYGGINRSFEMYYLNPFIPFQFANIDGEEGQSTGLDDNYLIFFNGRYNFKINTSIYGELIVDDYQLDSEVNSDYPNAFCYLLGVDGATKVINKEFYYNFEFIKSSMWIFTHEDVINNWQNLEFPMGYKYGPDCKSFILNIDHWINNNILIKFTNEYLEKGSINIFTPANQQGTKGISSPSSPVKYSNTIKNEVSYYLKNGIISIGLLSDTSYSDSISGYISFQIVGDLGWNWD